MDDSQLNAKPTALIVVDHGSRRDESNRRLLQVAELMSDDSKYVCVTPAHMELAEPSIAAAFRHCVQAGAERVLVFPFFLLPGRHWHEDIPALVAAAAAEHDGVEYLVTAPLGVHPLMQQIINDRIEHCLDKAAGNRDACDICNDSQRCQHV